MDAHIVSTGLVFRSHSTTAFSADERVLLTMMYSHRGWAGWRRITINRSGRRPAA
jgi:hypothetical protein